MGVFWMCFFSIFFGINQFSQLSRAWAQSLDVMIRSPFSLTAVAKNCLSPSVTEVGNVQVEMAAVSNQICGIYVTPISKPELIFRSYLWTEEGLLQIFDSYGDGPESSMTGAHTFVFLSPFDKSQGGSQLSWKVIPGESLISVQTITGQVDTVSATAVLMSNMSESEFTDHRPIGPAVAGGFQISHSNLSYFDLGFLRGQAPQSQPGGIALYYGTPSGSLTNGAGASSCVLKNSEIFTYSSNGAPHLKSRDEIMARIQRCFPPKVHLPF